MMKASPFDQLVGDDLQRAIAKEVALCASLLVSLLVLLSCGLTVTVLWMMGAF